MKALLIKLAIIFGIISLAMIRDCSKTPKPQPVEVVEPTPTPTPTPPPPVKREAIIPKSRGKISTTQPAVDNLFLMVNRARIARMSEPLVFSSTLQTGANARAKSLYQSGQWSHDDFSKVARKYGSFSKRGENLAKDFSNDDQVLNAWVNSSSHKKILIDKHFTHGAIGRYNNLIVLWVGSN